MGTSYNSSIVTDGLVLCLDAANPRSYPLSGNTWYDLSGNGNHGNLANSPTFNTDNGGNLLFDGVNDYVNIPQKSIYEFANSDPFSLHVWFKATIESSGYGAPITHALNGGRGYYFNITGNGTFYFDYWDGSLFRGLVGSSGSISMNVWTHVIATSASNSHTDMKLYKNGTLTSYSYRGTSTPNTINYNGVPLRVGSRGDGTYFSGNIAQALIYNRALSADEVRRNYNATRGRYGN